MIIYNLLIVSKFVFIRDWKILENTGKYKQMNKKNRKVWFYAQFF